MPQKFEKTFAHENVKKFSEYSCRQLKYRQHRIKSKTGISLKAILNVLKWLTCSTKILTLATTPFLLNLVGVICEFAKVPGVYTLLSF